MASQVMRIQPSPDDHHPQLQRLMSDPHPDARSSSYLSVCAVSPPSATHEVRLVIPSVPMHRDHVSLHCRNHSTEDADVPIHDPDAVSPSPDQHNIVTHPFVRPPIPPKSRDIRRYLPHIPANGWDIRRYPPLFREKWSLTTAIPC